MNTIIQGVQNAIAYIEENLAEDIAVKPNGELREISGNIAMSTSLAFGGCNTALIVERVENVLA